MKVTPRSLRTELPEPTELRGPEPADLPPEQMRLSGTASSAGAGERPVGFDEPAPPVPAGGFEALAAAIGVLADEERDARALAALDDAGRAQLAPRLTAVRDMAEAVRELLGLRREATDRLRAGGRG